MNKILKYDNKSYLQQLNTIGSDEENNDEKKNFIIEKDNSIKNEFIFDLN